MGLHSELDHLTAEEVSRLSYEDVVVCIAALSEALVRFWSSVHGWAPQGAADLLSRSRLDRFASLSRCLAMWGAQAAPSESEGRLILAWANLGSLVEGALKLVLAVFYDDYVVDALALDRHGVVRDPTSLQLEELRQFFLKREIFNSAWNRFFEVVQQKRNAIHFFKDREIGTWDDYLERLRDYLRFLHEVKDQLPYPD